MESTSYGYAKRDLDDLINETYNCDGMALPIDLTIYKIEDDKKVLITQEYSRTRGYNRGASKGERHKSSSYRLVSSIHLRKDK